MRGNPRVALVQDVLPFWGGAERVLDALLEIFPSAPIFTLLYNQKAFSGTEIGRREIRASFIDRLPLADRHYRSYLPLFPLAIEQFDFSGFDLILSSSYAVAHGVLPTPNQLHICYIHTPIRQAWHEYQTYLRRIGPGLGSWLARAILHYIRIWDVTAAARVDRFVTPSYWTARCVWRAYHRPAEVLYPPVDIEKFRPLTPRKDYYVAVSRLVRHKRMDLIVEAFSRLGYPLKVIGDGPEYRSLTRQAASNVQFLGHQPDEVVWELLGRAKAFVHAAEEDFGIAPVEAQAAGCPVIAFGGGGIRETVIEGQTGLFFCKQQVEDLIDAVQGFVRGESEFDLRVIRSNAERFSKQRFQGEFAALVKRDWDRFVDGNFAG